MRTRLDNQVIESFCYSRTPDAITQITNQSFSYEIAIEVETSPKTDARIKSILANYEKTFARNMRCAGLLLIVPHPATFKRYQELIDNQPANLRERIRLVSSISHNELDPNVYGTRLNHLETSVKKTLEKIRTHFNQAAQYVPINSTSYLSQPPSNTQIMRGSVTENENERF